ncbi:MAG TPA: hypothetical protein VF006_20555 [Longimicrobium sp.]
MDAPARGGRLVSEADYAAAISRRAARRDPTLDDRGGIGEVERWLTPGGEVCAYLFARYWKGEHDCDHYVID